MNTETANPEVEDSAAEDQLENQVTPEQEAAEPAEGNQDLIVASEIDSETPLSDAENRLVQLENAERQCQAAEAEWNSCKEETKYAKSVYDKTVDRLRSLARANANDAERPLLPENQNSGDESEPIEESSEWREVEISVLWKDEFKGLGASKMEALVDEVATLGGLEDLRFKVGNEFTHLSNALPQGIGEKLADELENRHLEYVSQYSPEQPAEVDEDLFDLSSFVSELTSEENWADSLESDDAFETGRADFLGGNQLDELAESVLETFAPETPELKQWALGWASAMSEWEHNQVADEYENVDLSDL